MPGRLIGIAALFAAAATPANAAVRSYIVTDFDGVRLEGPIGVEIVAGRGVSAKGEGDAELLERVDLSVSGRLLVIRLKPALRETRRTRSQAVKLTLTVPSLKRLTLSGSGSITAQGLDKLQADLIATGSGSMAVAGIASDRLTVIQTGSGSVELSGQARSAAMHLSGSGSLSADGLGVADLDVVLEGSGSVTAQADRAARIVANGSGNVTISGKAACTVRRSGSGAVDCG